MENPRHLNGRRKLVRIPRPKLPVWLDWVITIALGIGVALLRPGLQAGCLAGPPERQVL